MFVELHLIQSFAPSNLNRDDTGNPKDCEFGGARRARISSQCIKRAVRLHPAFSEATRVPPATRSKRLLEQLRQSLVQAGRSEEEANRVLPGFVGELLSKLDGNSDKTAVLLYVDAGELDAMTKALLERWDDLSDEKSREATSKALAKALTKEFIGRTSAPDIALFGRMLAEKPLLNLDAACQVAHAISTHRVTMEMDFYTAVDDLNPDDTAGAGMMGFTGFNSACFYRYARVDWDKLVENLDGDVDLARRTLEGFLRASVQAVPSGKQNSFAAQNQPSLLFATVRAGGGGWSLANAFERPVRPDREGGFVAPSVKALDAYWGRLGQVYGRDGIVAEAAVCLEDVELEALEPARLPTMEAWVSAVLAALPAGAAV